MTQQSAYAVARDCGWWPGADNPRRDSGGAATRFLVAKVSGGAARHQTQDTPRNSVFDPLFLVYRALDAFLQDAGASGCHEYVQPLI
jgi:hypothetical protein